MHGMIEHKRSSAWWMEEWAKILRSPAVRLGVDHLQQWTTRQGACGRAFLNHGPVDRDSAMRLPIAE